MTAPPETTTAIRRDARRLSSEQLLESLEHFPGVYWVTDAALRLTACGGAGLRDQGLDPDQLVGMHMRDIPGGSAAMVETHVTAVEEGRDGSYEIRYGERDFVARVRPLHDEDGAVVGVVGVGTDVTERVQAEEELRARERELATLTEHAPDIMVRFDRELRHLFVSPAVEVSTGFPPEHFLGKTNRELGMPEHHCRLWENELNIVFESGEPHRFGFEFPGPNGTRWFEACVVAELGADGCVETVLSATRDSTEIRRAEQERAASEGRYRDLFERATAARRALEESERRFRGAFDDAAVGMVLTDTAGRILRVNPAFAEMLCHQPEELQGRQIQEVTHPDDREEVAADVQLMIDGLKDRRIADKRYVRRDGRVVHAHIGVSPVRDENGAVAMLIAQVEDVTELRRLEAELVESERLRVALVENSRDLLMVLDLDGTVRLASRSVEEILGYRPDQVVGRPLRELIHPDDFEPLRGRLHEVVAGAASGTAVSRVRTTDGRFLPLEGLVAASRSDDGTPAFFVVSARDVSERLQLEEQLRHAQKLEAVGRLAGGIAHDFNNLLLAIQGNAELALRDLEQERPGAIDEVREILDAADRAARLTRQLLAFSRRQVLRPDVLDLREVVGDMVKLLRRLIGENIELTTVWPQEPVWVEADQSQLEQVVANLAVNAREAMPAGGHLGLEIARRNHHAVLRVSDTGIGMDAETASRIFEPFFTSKDGGTGLGLATVHGIVTQSHGEITLTTAPGVGTTFEITLPRTSRSPSASATAPTAPTARTQPGAETVLLVEDDPAVRRIVSKMLQSLGYAVVAVAGGEGAVAAGRQLDGKVDLLLTDMMMRGSDGHATAARIRELQPRVRVLYMSGYTGDSVLQLEELPPLTAFLEKPFTADELALAIRQLRESD